MKKLKDLLMNVFGVSENDFHEDRSLENMGLDSISIVEFQIQIERTLNIDEGRLTLVHSDTLQTITERIEGLLHVELKGV